MAEMAEAKFKLITHLPSNTAKFQRNLYNTNMCGTHSDCVFDSTLGQLREDLRIYGEIKMRYLMEIGNQNKSCPREFN